MRTLLLDAAERAARYLEELDGRSVAPTPEAVARLAGRTGSGLIATDPQADLVKAYVSAGGSGPRYAEVAMCYAKTEKDAQQTAHRHFGWALTGWLTRGLWSWWSRSAGCASMKGRIGSVISASSLSAIVQA